MKDNGVSFLGLLTLIFIIFKLLHKIDWSWWIVLLPLYGPIVAVLGIAIFGFILYWFAMFVLNVFKG